MSASAPQPEDDGAVGFGAWYALFVLLLAYVFNFVDRTILAIVADDVKADMGLSDTELGFLLGPAFAICNTLASFPLARWADRGSRRTVIAISLFVWSAMTVASGVARSFTQMAIARFGIGIGEAGGTPPSHSMISDLFPPERRAFALSIYAWGIYIGLMFGFLGGGWVRDAFDWRTAFFVAGAPGILIAFLIRFTIREPRRGAFEGGGDAPEAPPLGEVVRTLAGLRAFRWLVVAACFQSLAGYTILAWTPAFLGRVHGMSGTEIGTTFGLMAGITGALGTTLGGALTDRFARRDARWLVWLPAIVSTVALPFALPFYLHDDRTLSLAAFAPYYLLNNMYVGPLWTVAQNLVAPRMRALAAATLLALLNVVGLGVGPLVVGALNDALAPQYGAEAIRYSMLWMALAGGGATVFFWVCGRSLRDELVTRPDRAGA